MGKLGFSSFAELDLNVLLVDIGLGLEEDDGVSLLESLVVVEEGLNSAGLVSDHDSNSVLDSLG